MDAFEFLTVIISIVIAVAMSEVLVGWGRIIRFRASVETYWLHTGWTALVVVVMLRYWWSIWQFRTMDEWNFAMFVLILAPALVLIQIAFLLTPELTGRSAFRFQEYYFGNAQWFFNLGAVFLASNVLSNLIIRKQMPWSVENGVRIFGIVLLLGLASSRREWLHKVLFVVAAAALMIFLGSVQYWLG